MKLKIHYQARYLYEKPAGFSPHTIRLFPRRDKCLSVRSSQFSAPASADVQYRTDLFDNLTAHCFFPETISELPFTLNLDLELEEKNPFHFLLASHALHIPFVYQPDEALVLGPYLIQPEKPLPIPGLLTGSERTPTVEALVQMTSWIHENIGYERREEGDPFSPWETLERGCGSCRDMAVLQVAILRTRGLAARLVSGFLWEPETVDAADRRAENALHAWVEAYIPGAGWIGLDPTNGVFADQHRIPTAVGITPHHIAPISGHYYGKESIASRLETTLEIHSLP
jgi:transglutaminase-like putative cysteine protease